MRDGHTSPRMILGSGRSGTTWVLDCLAEANELRPIFEPLNPSQSTLGYRYACRAMASSDSDDTLERFFLDHASGRVRSRWIDYRGLDGLLFPRPARFMTKGFAMSWLRAWQTYIHDRRVLRPATRHKVTLTKCIRANLMAGWLTRTVGFRTALVVRHPCAVVESQIRLGKPWDPTFVLGRYRADRRLHEVTDGLYLDLLNTKLTTLQALTLNWIIENQWPVEQSRQCGYVVVHFEDLLSRPATAWPYLCDSLELKRVPNSTLLNKPSQQAAVKPARHGQQWLQPRWRSHLTPDQLGAIQGMLDATNCSLYRTDEVGPVSTLRAGDAT